MDLSCIGINASTLSGLTGKGRDGKPYLRIVPHTAGPGGFLLGYHLEDPMSGDLYRYVEHDDGYEFLQNVKTGRGVSVSRGSWSFDISLLKSLISENDERLDEMSYGWHLERKEQMFIISSGSHKSTHHKRSEVLGVAAHRGVERILASEKHQPSFEGVRIR